MAKVKITGIPLIEKNIRETFNKVRVSKALRKEIGAFVIGRLKGEARRSKPLNSTRSFPALRNVSVIIREDLAEQNPTHPAFKPDRSNLTFTGQLIDSIRFLLTSDAVLIEVPNTKRKKLSKKGVIIESEINSGLRPARTNKEVDKRLRKRGFRLYTAKGIESEPRILKRINGITKKFIRRAIKVNFGS